MNDASIAKTLKNAARLLAMVTHVPQLEAEILLSFALQKSRSDLYARFGDLLSDEKQLIFQKLLDRRLQGEPIAYITGHKEFWSLDLIVTKETLIPRPETELLVETALMLLRRNERNDLKIADLGTGSGAIALAMASELPALNVYATDKSSAALKVARLNAERLHIQNVTFLEGVWCEPLGVDFDLIVSNPPYIAENDSHLKQGDLRFEPESALISGKNGLMDLEEIIFSAKHHLKDGGYLLLEHGYQQAAHVRDLLTKARYEAIETRLDYAGLERMTFCYHQKRAKESNCE